MRHLLLLLICINSSFAIFSQAKLETVVDEDCKMKGLSFVAPPNPFNKNPMLEIQELGADWLAVIPYGMMKAKGTEIKFGQSSWQWWGETPTGAEETIKKAHSHHLNVMLKPQVYIHGDWTGNVQFETEEEWKRWEASNDKYILLFAEIAERNKVPVFCIGTEWKKTVVEREKYWRSLIKRIREIYSGDLVYAANWDEYSFVPFWDALDYIGINTYFPLCDHAMPDVSVLKKAWQPIEKKIASISDKFDKPIIFTEFGYMSVESCAHKTWELEKDRSILKYNEQAQANAISALYETFWDKPYWAGSFLWKWYPNQFASERRTKKDYTPQGKKALGVLREWFLK